MPRSAPPAWHMRGDDAQATGDVASPDGPQAPRRNLGVVSCSVDKLDPEETDKLASQLGLILAALGIGQNADPRVRRPSNGAVGLLTSMSPGTKRRNLAESSQPSIMVSRMSQYLNVQSLIIGLVYLVRYLGVWSKSESGNELPATAEQVQIWYVTAAVLADKFTNVSQSKARRQIFPIGCPTRPNAARARSFLRPPRRAG